MPTDTSPMDAKTLTPQQIAEQVRDTMFANDQASRGLGMQFIEVGPGRATLTMTVRADMLNGFAIIHGGFVTTLADSAFAFACNSYNEQTVASGISVDFIAPAREGDVLTATAREVALSGRTGVYDITVTNQHGAIIAVMRGKSYRLKGRAVFPQ
ncbi:hydroxyphenylacetyl-CoA thioesterase PaaI [Denitromonas sp.]|uniref:hydroxyphenylacetyl-CoA thioesterase PaaI n=1 Tax=Denitromonas sp. TaxID=2734609 RepID=UPI002AFDD647|nr:hydroxyphenylacetyl-CoA thioesterase PaaI [Denitromonas sp.]